jgi:hypothetical protein
VKENAPEVLDVVVAVEGPVKVTVAPLAPAPVSVPDKVNVCAAEENETGESAPFNTTDWLGGVYTYPVCVTATVYVPSGNAGKVNVPVALAVVELEVDPVSVTVAPEAPGPLIVPTMLCGVDVDEKLSPKACPLVIVTFCDVGDNTYPVALGVTT